MITYDEVKKWFEEKENKQKVVVGLCFVVVFLVGFGTGNYDKTAKHNKLPSNYTIKQPVKPSVVNGGGDGEGGVKSLKVESVKLKFMSTTSKTSVIDGECVVKGNISSGGRKLYHVQGGSFYKKVKAEQCFNSEADALAAGFLKSSR